ncbi:major facilitator superfamily domain-containing protein [Hyaloscypha finlandica]|nr:major facilitator superfamily domain-containing protein [Hyaloscypha finlandica]
METPTSIPSGIQSPEESDMEFKFEETRPPSLYPVQSRMEHPQSLPREIAFVGVLCMAQLMTQAALAQSIAPLHIIGDSFNITSPGQLSWFPAAYSLTVGTFILIAGRLGDLYGHKRFFIAGFLWFGFWSLMAGFTIYVQRGGGKGAIFFDICRALQGIGPAFLLPNAIAILGRTYAPSRRQEMVFSLFGATAPTGFTLGAIFSSLFAQRVWWPWAFWVMGIICFLFAIAGYFAIPHTPSPYIFRGKDGITAWARVDGWGSITGIMALVLINFAWNQGPVVGWKTPYTYILLIVGFLFLSLFGFIESRATFPLIPRDALSTETAFVLGCVAAGWSSFGIWVYYLWQFCEELKHASPLLTSAYFVPTTVSGFFAALTTGMILHRVPASFVMLIAMLAFMTGTILVATAPVSQIYWAQFFVAVIVMPWGMDMSFPAATILLSNRMRREEQGVAASLVNTIINYSISIGLGMAGTIEGRVGGTGQEGLLRGYRGALYFALGISGLGVLTALAFGTSHLLRARGDEAEGADVRSRERSSLEA